MIAFRHAHPDFPFLWEGPGQPEGRWNRGGEGPVQYFADTSDGAWAEFLRHEEITAPEDLLGVRRAIWAVEIGEPELPQPNLSPAALLGDRSSYTACQAEADVIRAQGAEGLVAPSAALRSGMAGGWRVEGGLQEGPARDGRTIALFGDRPDLVGWRVAVGAPEASVLGRVEQF